MSDDIIYVSIARRIRQRDARKHRSTKAQSRQIGKVYNRATDGSADAAAHQRVFKPQIDTEQGRLRDAEQYGDKTGDTEFFCSCVFIISGKIPENRTALSNDCYRHERIEDISSGIRQKLRFDGAEDMVKAGNDHQLLETAEDRVSEYAQILRHPYQRAGQSGRQTSSDRSYDRKQKNRADQSCQKRRYQKPYHLRHFFLKENVQLCRHHAHEQRHDDAALEADQLHAHTEGM